MSNSTTTTRTTTTTTTPALISAPKYPRKVCIIVEPSPLTYICGYTNRFQALLDHLHESEDRVEMVTTEVVAPHPPSAYLSFPIHHTFGFRLPHYKAMSISCDWSLKVMRVIRRFQPDIIHVTSPGIFVMGAILWSRIFQIPLIASYHTHLPVYVRSYVRPRFLSRISERIVWLLIRLVHSMADLTVVTSPQVLEEFECHKIPRCQVWQKGIDTDRFHPKHYNSRMRERMTDGHPNDFLMVYIGRLATEKRLDELRRVLDVMPSNARLCMVGTGPEEAELRKLFQDRRCVFTGQLTGEELSQAFACGDVFCMPSDSETLGFVVLESMASGVPVIGVKAGGVQDLIHDNKTGYLVPPGDVDAFMDRLQKLQTNSKLRREMSLAGRQEMEQWSWRASMSRLRNEQYTDAHRNFEKRLERRLWRILTFQWLPQLSRRSGTSVDVEEAAASSQQDNNSSLGVVAPTETTPLNASEYRASII